MAYNGSGTFSRVFNWVTDKSNSVPVTASRQDTEDDGFATGLSNAICKDGQTVTTQRIPFVLGTSALSGAVNSVSYSFTSDTDTGMYSPASGQVAWACDGTQVLASTATTVTVPVALAITGNAIFAGTTTTSATASAGFFNGFGAMPVGSVIDYAGSAAPAGWLLCFGQSLVRTDYAALFTAIGTTFGSADGTHFTLPDYRGRASYGKDNMGGSAASRITAAGGNFDATVLGGTGGAQNHTLTQGELSVNLGTAATTVTMSDTANQIIAGGGGTTGFAGGGTHTTGTLSATATTTITNGSGGNAHTILSPAIVLNKIIFAGI